MGKRSKQGASLRNKKRADEVFEELTSALIEQAEETKTQSIKNEDLFVIDTDRREHGSAPNKQSLLARKKRRLGQKQKAEPSEKEQRQIQKVLRDHGEAGAIALAKKGRARWEQKRQAKQLAGMTKAGKPSFDLWSNTGSNVVADSRNKKTLVPVTTGSPAPGGTAPVALLPMAVVHDHRDGDLSSNDNHRQPPPKTSNRLEKARRYAKSIARPAVAVEVAHSGQSYRPDRDLHQDVIGEALSIEIRRNEAEEYKRKPISQGLTPQTLSCLVSPTDSEDESSDEEDDATLPTATTTTTKLFKKKEKLTRAQRNKQKRVKAEQTALQQRKQNKQFMHQINEVQIHAKSIHQTQMQQSERREEIRQLKLERDSKPLGKDVWNTLSEKDPIRAPSLPVALTEELERVGGGTLRTIAPKGSMVTDRVESMMARGMMKKKRMEGRRVVQGKKRRKIGRGNEYLLI